MQLLLASSSRYRRDLLARLRLPFYTADPAIQETRLAGENAAELVARLAAAKAHALAQKYPDHLIIGSDQVAGFDDEVLGKPGSVTAACAQLATLSGREVTFSTGLCLLNTATGLAHSTIDLTTVTFRNLTHHRNCSLRRHRATVGLRPVII